MRQGLTLNLELTVARCFWMAGLQTPGLLLVSVFSALGLQVHFIPPAFPWVLWTSSSHSLLGFFTLVLPGDQWLTVSCPQSTAWCLAWFTLAVQGIHLGSGFILSFHKHLLFDASVHHMVESKFCEVEALVFLGHLPHSRSFLSNETALTRLEMWLSQSTCW